MGVFGPSGWPFVSRGVQSPARVFIRSSDGGKQIKLSSTAILESAGSGSTVGTATAPGTTGTPSWSLSADPDTLFDIDASTGVVTTTGALDYETATSHSITVSVSGVTPSLPDKVFTIAVIDVSVTLTNTVAPAVTGTEEVGQTLSCSTGTWTNSPSSYTYQWFRAITSGGSIVTSGGLFTGNAIGSATSATYLLDALDEGEKIYCEVTAHKAEASNVMAQSNATGAIAGVAYTGTGDLKGSALGFWALRAYTAAGAGGNCVRLRRDSDDTEQDFVTLANGSLDVASISSFKGAANLFVRKVYDQSGNARDLVQATAARQPALILSGLGSLPVIRFAAASQQWLSAATTLNQSQPMTISGAVKHTASGGQQNLISLGGTVAMGFRNAGNNDVFTYANAVHNAVASDGTCHSLIAVINDASSHIYVDGVDDTGNPSNAGTGANALVEVGAVSSSQFLDGDLVEIGWWGSAFSGADVTAVEANQSAYWGI